MAKDRAHDPRRVFEGFTGTHKDSSISHALVPTTTADNTYNDYKSVGLSGKGKAKDVAEHLKMVNTEAAEDAKLAGYQGKEMTRY